jgi:hypothetical protein
MRGTTPQGLALVLCILISLSSQKSTLPLDIVQLALFSIQAEYFVNC